MRFCGREADHGERTRAAAEATMVGEIKREVAPAFVRNLCRVFDSRQGEMFAPLDPAAGSKAFGGQGSPFEEAILSRCRWLYAEGERGESAVAQAAALAISERKEAVFRDMEGHWYREGGRGVEFAIAECRAALSSVDVEGLAVRLVRGEPLETKPKRSVIDIDNDDLLGGGL